jgi:DNA polymerase-3 subunit gamma/tau
LRDALSLLEQVTAFCGGAVTASAVRSMLGMASVETIRGLMGALLKEDVAMGIQLINQAVDSGVDPQQLNREVVQQLHELLKTSAGFGDHSTSGIDDLTTGLGLQRPPATKQIAQQLQLFSDAYPGFSDPPRPQLPLELAFLQAVQLAQTASGGVGAALSPATERGSDGRATGRSGPHLPAATSDMTSEIQPTPYPSLETGGVHRTADQDLSQIVLGRLEQDWARVLAAARSRSRIAEAVLRSCSPLSVEGDVVTLQCPASFHAKAIGQPDNHGIVEEAISRVAGQRCSVRCVAANRTQAPSRG